jgi:hypothetical protein
VPLSVLRMGLAGQSTASGSACLPGCSCSWLTSPGGWDTGFYCFGAGQVEFGGPALNMGQGWWPSRRSSSPVRSARIMAMMALLRSRVWPGSQGPSHPFRLGECRVHQAQSNLRNSSASMPMIARTFRRGPLS